MPATGRPSAYRVAGVALVVTLVLTVAKFSVWAITDSLAVLSQAVDSVVDIVALGLLFLGLRITDKPADESHHYGHGKAENLVAYTQTLLLGGVVAIVVVQSVGRLPTGGPPVTAPGVAIALMAISIAVDAVRVHMLSSAARATGSEALGAGALNFAADIGTATVALASLLLEEAGVRRADEVGALIVSVAVVVAGLRLGKRSVDVLMDRAPGGPVEAIEAASRGVPGVTQTRRVRVRPGGSRLFADVTVATGRTASVERAHEVAETVENAIERAVPGTDVVVHVEPAARGDLLEQVHAAASRTEGVQEIHNVAVHSVEGATPQRLHVTLHAKTSSDVSLQEAHDLSDRIEASVVEELGRGVRVDTHIEPLEASARAYDVTSSRPDIVASVERLAAAEPEVIDCHDVLVTSTDNRLSVVAHVRGRGDLSLARLHDASRTIEESLRAIHPEIGPVLIHFEPTED
jgi:cation diffusion facilitator family transporter